MDLTVGNQAVNLYKQYTLQNSNTYKNNTMDPSVISKADYNVANIANALDALESTDNVDLYSVGNVDSYAGSVFEVSQLSEYGKLSTKNLTVSELLPGGSTDKSLSQIYSLIAPNQEADSEFLQGVVQKEEAKAKADIESSSSVVGEAGTGSTVDSYKQFLNSANTGSLLDASI